jgi:probable HAF family extracellular repeat protein
MNLRLFYQIAPIIALATQGSLAGQTYEFQVVECGTYDLIPRGINNAGIVVGGAQEAESDGALAFVYANGVCRTFGPALGGVSFTGIADNGAAVGIHNGDESFLVAQGAFENLPPYPGSSFSDYCCLSASTGALAGNYEYAPTFDYVGFLYSDGKFVSLPYSSQHFAYPEIAAMNAKGIVVGTMSQQYGFTYTAGSMKLFQYPEAAYTTFNGINNNGLIVGTYVNLSGGKFGVFSYNLETGVWKDLNFGDYAAAIPVGVTDSGVIAAALGPSGGLLIATPAN